MAKSGSISHRNAEQMAHGPLNRPTLSEKQKNQYMEQAMQPVTVSNLAEIKQLITMIMQADSEGKEIVIDTNLEWTDEKGRQTEKVTATTKDTSIYKLLIDGMDVVKKYMQSVDIIRKAIEKVEDKDDIPASLLAVWNIQRMHFNVDTFIEKKFGGKRNGLRLRWIVPDGIYEWDPYTIKLYKIEDDENAKTSDDTKKT